MVRLKTENEAEAVVQMLSDYFHAHAGSSADQSEQPLSIHRRLSHAVTVKGAFPFERVRPISVPQSIKVH